MLNVKKYCCKPIHITSLFIILLLGWQQVHFANGDQKSNKKKLSVHFNGNAKIEIGSTYVGMEFHNSHPVPQRFSFYYPVANSIDLSTDYWMRDTTFAMTAGLKFGDSEIEWFDNQSLPFNLTPFSVDFYKKDQLKEIEISYSFTKNKPAVVVSYSITNKTNTQQDVELYSIHALSFRTSHTFKLSSNINPVIVEKEGIIVVDHDDYETQNASMFIANCEEQPLKMNVVGTAVSDKDYFKNYPNHKRFIDIPSVYFVYKKKLKPAEKLFVVQSIGVCKQNESNYFAHFLKHNYKNEIDEFENNILSKVYERATFVMGDEQLDRTERWSRAILEVNKHYIDGSIEPMPCPAEYNFYFTHDVLLTNLAAVNYDLERVKSDLNFITKHANKENIIPHAYYWKDSSFVTEYADRDNWNNFWLIIVSAEYLKHSGDKNFAEKIYPFVAKALKQALATKGDDDLMWSYRPDWWDIGKRYGQRSYMTILAIKAIRSFLYFSSNLNKNEKYLNELEDLSERMKVNLNEKLWFDKYGYLMNYTDPEKLDEHYYSGSLIAAHYGLIDKTKMLKMIKTANEKIVDKKIGVYTAFPMDFDELQDYWHFVNNEAGDKYYYLNGGIWPHSNAWYSLALIAADQKEDAVKFIKNIMTIDGIMSGPNGQPSMYEVRNGNHNDPKVYGTIDKPQFMWAAGWYLYTLYYLYGLSNNEWNISFEPYLPVNQNKCSFKLSVNNKLINVEIIKGPIQKVEIDGKEINSFVFPNEVDNSKNIRFTIGKLNKPVLKTTNSIMKSCLYDEKLNKMNIELEAFSNHKNQTIIHSKNKPKNILLNGNIYDESIIESIEDGYSVTMNINHENKTEIIEINF